MMNFLFGVLACAIVYTFFPALAVKPSQWLRKAWATLRQHMRPNPNGEG